MSIFFFPVGFDVILCFRGRTFHSGRSGTAFTGGVCSLMRGGGINEVRTSFLARGRCRLTRVNLFPPLLFQFGNVNSMAITLCQSLGQNIGMRWNNARNSAGRNNQMKAFRFEGAPQRSMEDK